MKQEGADSLMPESQYRELSERIMGLERNSRGTHESIGRLTGTIERLVIEISELKKDINDLKCDIKELYMIKGKIAVFSSIMGAVWGLIVSIFLSLLWK